MQGAILRKKRHTAVWNTADRSYWAFGRIADLSGRSIIIGREEKFLKKSFWGRGGGYGIPDFRFKIPIYASTSLRVGQDYESGLRGSMNRDLRPLADARHDGVSGPLVVYFRGEYGPSARPLALRLPPGRDRPGKTDESI